MKYPKIIDATFVERPNRFIAKVMFEGHEDLETVHVKNTGRCKELLLPGAKVVLSESMNPDRKTKYDLIGVYKEGLGFINMDSQAPNEAVKEWLKDENGSAKNFFPGITFIKPECKYGDSRVDFYFEQGEKKTFMEVKGVTLEKDGVGFFPDAPSDRAIKHINEMIKAVSEGYEAYIAFVIQLPKVKTILPNYETHPAFGNTLLDAINAGVKIIYLYTKMDPASMEIVDAKIIDKAFPLRPHHLLCSQHFEGKGYSPEFTAHMTDFLAKDKDNTLIVPTLCCDYLCSHCPFNKMGRCETEEKVLSYDKEVLEKCKIKEGQLISLGYGQALAFQNIISKNLLQETCKDCSWMDICLNHKFN